MDAYVLVDFDNLLGRLKGIGLSNLATRVNATVQKLGSGVQDVHLRLYGGWYGAVGLTRAGTLLSQEIGRDFPVVTVSGGRIQRRLSCEIASSLIDSPGDVLPFTFRMRAGMRSRLSGLSPVDCVNVRGCTIGGVSKWSRGTCPQSGCPVTANTAFNYYEQKLVDTLLCCDLIALSVRGMATPIFVVSDDDDVVPALLLAARLGARIHVMHMRQPRPGTYDMLLKNYNVSSTQL